MQNKLENVHQSQNHAESVRELSDIWAKEIHTMH